MKKSNRRIKVDSYTIKSNLKGNKTTILHTLNSLKIKTHPEKLFDLYYSVITKDVIDKVNDGYFPSDITKIINPNNLLNPASLLSEIIWSISTLLLYKDKINSFVKKSYSLEIAILNEAEEECFKILETIDRDFGQSHWLIQNKIATTQHWLGNDSKKELVKNLRETTNDKFLVDILIYFISKRVEGTSIPGYLQSELSKIFRMPEGKSAHDYLKTKIFDINNLTTEQVSILLRIDFSTTAIDYYESLIATLRWVINEESVLKTLSPFLEKPVSVLYKATRDRRLIPILIGFSIDQDFSFSVEREQIIERYTSGEYEKSLALAHQYLAEDINKTDISMLFIALKSEIQTKQICEYDGLLHTISKDLRRVMNLTEDSYSAALSLNMLNDRFINQNWSIYLRTAVMNELTVQDFDSSLDFLRDLYVCDPHISPFTFLLSLNEDYVNKNISRIFPKHFLITKKVFKLAISGVTNDEVEKEISKGRYLKYLGRYYLTTNNLDKALSTFTEALTYNSELDTLKCSAALIIVHLRKGDLLSAIKLLVDTYIKWPDVPTALPFDEVVGSLEDPDEWPESICLSITLALYTNFFKYNKLAHLRYAFETYNLNNNITSPSDLIIEDNIKNIDYVKLYLRLVWRPEIMGQTILYSGTKDIEETRIQVCKTLVEIDTENASLYQTEIRERVKNLELAKATKLVDQSRVYVDVTAIKKTLKTKLGDVYSQYKNSLIVDKNDGSEFVEVLADVFQNLQTSNTSMSQIMSSMHIIGDEDMQFAAMFSEITNEFLLGEHGLNAYLSTRVRHGKFSNAIRKPIADENLITEISEGTENYTKNIYWADLLNELEEIEKEKVLSLLEVFGKKIDDIISHVRDNLIQVAIMDDLSSTTGSSHALFSYRTSNVERIYAQSKLKNLVNIDEFIDFCIEILWEKTDDNLIKVKKIINSSVKSSILLAFDKLNESLGYLGYTDRLGELHNHIARAKTNIQHQISNVSTWFTRSEVYDRPDYDIDFSVLIAKTMVTNLISGSDNWNGLNIKASGVTRLMPGRTLDGMVDVFCASFENAIEHSGLLITEINIDVEIKIIENRFKIIITNNISSEIFTSKNVDKINEIMSEISKKDTRIKAQKERGSGFHKIWSTINSPQYKEPKLSFGYCDMTGFSVTIEFKIEGAHE